MSVESLARRLGVGARHLRRLFLRHLGATPLAVAQTRRLHFARSLLRDTSLQMSEVALASGFSSLRRFNVTVKKTSGRTPTELRRSSSSPHVKGLELRFSARQPYDYPGILAFLKTRSLSGLDSVSPQGYRRIVPGDDGLGIVDIRLSDDGLVLSLPSLNVLEIQRCTFRARRMFDLDADPGTIAAHLGGDPLLRPLLRKHPGVRIPGSWDAFEVAIRAIVGQQISVAAASTIMERIVARYGGLVRSDDPELFRLFPTPEQLSAASFHEIGLPLRRAETLRGLSRAVAEGRLKLELGPALESTVSALIEIPGIGPWTAHYIAMRAVGEPDAFPAGDLGLRKAASGSGTLLSEKALERLAESWRPWRAYAAILLWRSLW